MQNNKEFINILKKMIGEELSKKSPLLESPVKTQGEILVENRIKNILKTNTKKD
tara:strand:- start:225 stop:386 length:162 start_codon:yes stop_codon:yes gene_type:complete